MAGVAFLHPIRDRKMGHSGHGEADYRRKRQFEQVPKQGEPRGMPMKMPEMQSAAASQQMNTGSEMADGSVQQPQHALEQIVHGRS